GLLQELIRSADVVVDNFRPGTMERWGFDDRWYETNTPRVVRCSISGYGPTGPRAGDPGYDFILQAQSGLMAITGPTDGTPVKLGVAIVDLCTGLMATTAVLAALFRAQRQGVGAKLEVNLHDVSLQMLINVAANQLASGVEPRRYGNGHPNIVPYTAYRTADGQLAVAVGNDAQFAKFAACLGRSEWAADERFARNQDRVVHRVLLDDLVREVLRTETTWSWEQRLSAAGIPSGPVRSVGEALSSTHAQAREMVQTIEHVTAGAVRLLRLPLDLDGAPAVIRRPPPALGQHTRDVLMDDLGVARADFEALVQGGIV
ncbi:MAG: CaiB/BaiF CoA-transferase family protein, partial [Phycisphaeraceae bacterium]